MSLQNHPHNQSQEKANAVHCFSVRAVADPGMMPRLMELWAKRGLMPDRWHGVREETSGTYVDIDIESGDVDQALATQMAAAMREIFGVAQVLLSEKRRAIRV
jgi:hypothetical protein